MEEDKKKTEQRTWIRIRIGRVPATLDLQPRNPRRRSVHGVLFRPLCALDRRGAQVVGERERDEVEPRGLGEPGFVCVFFLSLLSVFHSAFIWRDSGEGGMVAYLWEHCAYHRRGVPPEQGPYDSDFLLPRDGAEEREEGAFASCVCALVRVDERRVADVVFDGEFVGVFEAEELETCLCFGSGVDFGILDLLGEGGLCRPGLRPSVRKEVTSSDEKNTCTGVSISSWRFRFYRPCSVSERLVFRSFPHRLHQLPWVPNSYHRRSWFSLLRVVDPANDVSRQ